MQCKVHEFRVPVFQENSIDVVVRLGELNYLWEQEVEVEAVLELACHKCGKLIRFIGRDNIKVDVG